MITEYMVIALVVLFLLCLGDAFFGNPPEEMFKNIFPSFIWPVSLVVFIAVIVGKSLPGAKK